LNLKYSDAYNNRGIVYYSLGEYDKAVENYTEAIKIDKKYSEALYNRGLAILV